MKYLLVVLVLVVAWHVWRRGRLSDAQPPAKKTLAAPETMVNCQHCGVHLPQSDAISYQGQHYCSQAHLRAAHPVN